jgi:uncharacterized protein (DUF934 family)
MALIDQGGFIDDEWVDIGDRARLPGESKVLVPLARYLDLIGDDDQGHLAIGLQVPNTIAALDLVPYLSEVELIAIEFPSSADGSGFSLARQLRRLGFAGELRAKGALIADQLAFAIACGFDTVQVPGAIAARQPEAQWRTAMASIDSIYQAHYAGVGQSILEQRMAARQQP